MRATAPIRPESSKPRSTVSSSMSVAGCDQLAPRYTCNSPGVGRTLMRGLSTSRAALGLAMASCHATCGHAGSALMRACGA